MQIVPRQRKSNGAFMADTISPTPSDIVGAIQRGLSELNQYLNQPSLAVDVNASVEHLSRLLGMFDLLAQMQASMPQPAANGAVGEARTN